MIVGILLAAGCSRRFGGDKRLLPLENGVPIAVQSLRNMQSAVDRLVVVVRDDSDLLLGALCSEMCEVLICPNAKMGMGHTLSHAVRESKDADGWLVGLADMPFIEPETYRLVVDSLRKEAIVSRPRCQGRPGHPVGFLNDLYNELSALTGDEGARQFLCSYKDETLYLDTEDFGVLIDVDRPEDIMRHSLRYAELK